MITVYGIKNCNTVKKALQWLNDNNLSHELYDYKKHGAHQPILTKAIAMYGWANVINRKGTTWRQLSDDIKNGITEEKAFNLAIEKPSVIKRPLIAKGDDILLGFDEDTYKTKLL